MWSMMKMRTAALLASAALLCTAPLAAATKAKHGTARVKARTAAASSRLHASSRTSSRRASRTQVAGVRRGHRGRVQLVNAKPRFRGQQFIDPARTMEIQEALIREHYLTGQATGEWDQATRDALIRFQDDNHWQTKILPDARALIKLGLGPSQQNLLNPESAAIASPYQSVIEKSSPGGSN